MVIAPCNKIIDNLLGQARAVIVSRVGIRAVQAVSVDPYNTITRAERTTRWTLCEYGAATHCSYRIILVKNLLCFRLSYLINAIPLLEWLITWVAINGCWYPIE